MKRPTVKCKCTKYTLYKNYQLLCYLTSSTNTLTPNHVAGVLNFIFSCILSRYFNSKGYWLSCLRFLVLTIPLRHMGCTGWNLLWILSSTYTTLWLSTWHICERNPFLSPDLPVWEITPSLSPGLPAHSQF